MSKLNETRNLVDLYVHHAGKTEVPKLFHTWACLSMIAACVSDRVFFRKFKSSKLTPNLFTFLLGPSGCLSGDTKVVINRGKRNSGRTYTLEELHRLTHGGLNHSRVWDQSIPSRVMSLKDDLVMYREIGDVIDSGVKQTYTVEIAGHGKIHATADHRFLTVDGYKRLDQLTIGEQLVVRGKPRREKRVQRFRRTISARFHPRARQKLVRWPQCPEGRVYPTIPLAWAVYEAQLNELPFEEYRRIVHEDPDAAQKLKYIPEGLELHHKDGNDQNDVADNLETIEPKEHGRHHIYHHLSKMGHYSTTTAPVIGIKKRKIERVYDISMADQEAPNFLVNGVVLHNCGKGEAISLLQTYCMHLPILGVYNGNLTAQYLFKHISRRKEDDEGNVLSGGKMYLMLEELAMNIGSGPIAEDTVKHMTGLYKGSAYPIDKGTVSGGHYLIKDHCLNMIAGTTVEWAVKTIPRDAIEGGFLGRVAVIHAKYDPDHRITRPYYPPDYEQIQAHLLERFRMLTQYEGEFFMTAAAERIEDHWYKTRPAPTDEAMFPTWKREHDLSLKLAMILALAEIGPTDPLVIRSKHIQMAQLLVVQCHKAAPLLQRAAHMTQDVEHVELVRSLITRAGAAGIQRSALQSKLSPKGILKQKMDEALGTLVTENAVVARMKERAMWYFIRERRIRG